MGNTCYMNAILQAICGVDEFSKELYRVSQQIRSIELSEAEDAVMMSYAVLIYGFF